MSDDYGSITHSLQKHWGLKNGGKVQVFSLTRQKKREAPVVQLNSTSDSKV